MQRHLGSVVLSFALAAGAFAAEVPRPSPDLTISLPGGKQIQLDQFRGKVVALAFISTT